jgi:hypothetical protein
VVQLERLSPEASVNRRGMENPPKARGRRREESMSQGGEKGKYLKP